MNIQHVEELFQFIENSPSCFHAIETIRKKLNAEGFIELVEGRSWQIEKGKKYYVTRNLSSIIAFKIPENDFKNFHIVASHSDSPTFKIKENAEIEVNNKYVKLNTEKYGGMICSTWFDRPLSIAGRILVKEGNLVKTHLVNIDKDLVIIPNLAIHMNRAVNDGYKYNAQIDMLPLYGDNTSKGSLMKTVAQSVGVEEDSILGTDLFLYNRMRGTKIGANSEYISSPRLDDLECAYASLSAFLSETNSNSASVYCVFDNEEVGSGTKQGADSTLLYDVLRRINMCLGNSEEDYYKLIASSFMISADNAHALHPNYSDKSDPTNKVYINDGIVIKYNANQKYTTDAVSASIFKSICDSVNVPYQTFTNRSDILGGSTLGNISNAHVSLNTIDIGLAQLAMHSTYETAGAKDVTYLIDALKAFYNTSIEQVEDGQYIINSKC
ncbi:MAG: M18 family aminopeptidase [Clostridiales bacterium]|uniref:M18 family aminopeptidase n=1 Tax=Terrisporobacter sp. TaxID=1965305 RepID=UPI002A5877A8|nr:M18 family aminopeptidase [Terrisporobacter sp.]MDD7752979.1 M18 family aminopeptidase [Clostridiales bacterium]MDY4134114.1 M18 family aminopeptidase [Terrisporobacter sp.]